MKKIIMATGIVCSLMFGCATARLTVTSDLDRAVASFQEGFSIMKEDTNKAKKNFNLANETAWSAKTDAAVGEIDTKCQREKRSQVLFFSNCYLAYIDAVEKNIDLAAKHLEAMLENKSACSSVEFYVFPSGAVQIEDEDDGDHTIIIDFNKISQNNIQSLIKCFECESKAYPFLGNYYYEKHDYARSADMLTEFLKGKTKKNAGKEYDYAHSTRALDYYNLGRYREGIADLDVLIASTPKDANIYALRFVAKLLAYQAEGKKDKKLLHQAGQDYAKTLTLDPNNELAKEFGPNLKALQKGK